MSWRELHDPENRENPNAGNGGDLVKHTVYLTAIDYLVAEPDWSAELRVRECHAGRGMYAIPRGDGRRPLLECLYAPVGRDVGVVLHDVQRAAQAALGLWPANTAGLNWYGGSAVLNGSRLSAAGAGRYLLELYEMDAKTRAILRGVLGELVAPSSRVEVRILPEPDGQRFFDGELHIEENISKWDRQDLVLLDPFAMWRQDEHQRQRDRYGRIIESLIERGDQSPLLILFWTWGQAFTAADGDLEGTSTVVSNGYQDLRNRLHQAGRGFIRVKWRWGLQFGMWIVVPNSDLQPLCAKLLQRCNELRDHILGRGCKTRLAHPNVDLRVDRGTESFEQAS